MEDGVNGVQGLLPPLNLNSEDKSNREDCEVKEESVGKEDCVAKDEGGGGGGLIKNLISTFITPLSPRIGKDTELETENESEEDVAADGGDHREGRGVENGGEGGGIIGNLVSNFFHQSGGDSVVESEKEKEEEEEILVDKKIKRLKTENGANGDDSGSIIHNIVSHLPASIPDDAAPTADEATFLINSLVRD